MFWVDGRGEDGDCVDACCGVRRWKGWVVRRFGWIAGSDVFCFWGWMLCWEEWVGSALAELVVLRVVGGVGGFLLLER